MVESSSLFRRSGTKLFKYENRRSTDDNEAGTAKTLQTTLATARNLS